MATKSTTKDPRRVEAGKKAAATRLANKAAAAQREQEQQENHGNRFNWAPWVLLAIALIALLAVWRPWTAIKAAPDATGAGAGIVNDPTPAPEVAPATPAPTDTPQEASWPTNPEEAAKLFGGTADRWEVTPDGGWHLLEAHDRIVINPSSFVAEGYYDTTPGRDPRQMVFVVAMEVQGCTIWPLTPDRAQELFDAMASQKRYTTEQAMEYIDRVGW